MFKIHRYYGFVQFRTHKKYYIKYSKCNRLIKIPSKAQFLKSWNFTTVAKMNLDSPTSNFNLLMLEFFVAFFVLVQCTQNNANDRSKKVNIRQRKRHLLCIHIFFHSTEIKKTCIFKAYTSLVFIRIIKKKFK